MVELQVPSGLAPPSIRCGERASAIVANPDLALDSGGDVAGPSAAVPFVGKEAIAGSTGVELGVEALGVRSMEVGPIGIEPTAGIAMAGVPVDGVPIGGAAGGGSPHHGARLLGGFRAIAALRLSRSARSSVSARSNTSATSAAERLAARRSWARRSFSRAASPIVKRIAYRSADKGRTAGRRGAGMYGAAVSTDCRVASDVESSGRGAEHAVRISAVARTDSGTPPGSMTDPLTPPGATEAATATGNRRIDDGASVWGKNAASTFSTPALLRPAAAASSRSWFSAVTCRRSILAVVGLRAPATSISRTAGRSCARRAHSIRLNAASSERWSASTQ